MRSGYGAQMGSVFMPMSVRNRMTSGLPEHEKTFIARKPIMPAPPARVFDSKYIGSYLTEPEKASIYRERIQIEDAVRKLQEPLRPSLEVEKASKRMFYNKLSELDAKLRDQLSKGLLTPQQYMERTEAYRNEFDTAVQRADIADLQSRLASVGLPAPSSTIPESPIVAPRDFSLASILNPEGDLTRPIRISETPIASTPAVFQGTRPASQIQRPQIMTRDDPRRMLNDLFGALEESTEERINSEMNLTGGRPELEIGAPNVSGMVPLRTDRRPLRSSRTEEELQRRAIADALELQMGDWRREIRRNPELARKTIREVGEFEKERRRAERTRIPAGGGGMAQAGRTRGILGPRSFRITPFETEA